jgi:serine/threonine protein kinase
MVLHRDLKPANLLIGGIHAAPDNTSYVGARYGMVKVADFGLSRVTTLLKADLTPATVRTMLLVSRTVCSQALAYLATFSTLHICCTSGCAVRLCSQTVQSCNICGRCTVSCAPDWMGSVEHDHLQCQCSLAALQSFASRMDSRNDSRTSHNWQDSVNDTVNSMTLRARSCDELDKEASFLECTAVFQD